MLKKIFTMQDEDKSGYLTSSEVIFMSSNLNKIRSMYENIDKDKNGRISYTEYCNFFTKEDKKQSVEHLYKWLVKHKDTINVIRSHWVESVIGVSKTSLKTPLFVSEALGLLQHLNLDRQNLNSLHQFLHYSKILDKNYIYYGELISLVCYWYS